MEAEDIELKPMTMTFNEMIQSSKPVLVDFSAEWCGPCKMMAPILKDVKKEIGETAAIIKVDVDKNPAAAQQFQIQGVPTLILFKEGKLLWRQSGVVPKAGLVDVIKKYAS
jgi:thioredoxin 1